MPVVRVSTKLTSVRLAFVDSEITSRARSLVNSGMYLSYSWSESKKELFTAPQNRGVTSAFTQGGHLIGVLTTIDGVRLGRLVERGDDW